MSRIHIPIGYVRKQQLGFAFHGELINLIYPLKCNNPQDRLQGHLRMRWGYDACLKDGHARVRIEVQSEVRHLQVVGVSPTFWFHGLQNMDSIASQSHYKLIKFKWMGFSSSKLRKVDWLSLGICGLWGWTIRPSGSSVLKCFVVLIASCQRFISSHGNAFLLHTWWGIDGWKHTEASYHIDIGLWYMTPFWGKCCDLENCICQLDYFLQYSQVPENSQKWWRLSNPKQLIVYNLYKVSIFLEILMPLWFP